MLLAAAARAQEAAGTLSLRGQVRQGDHTGETEAPHDLYGDLALTGIGHGSRFDTFFRLERDFGSDDGASDFYAGSLQVPGAIPGVGLALGRQFVSEGPGGVFVADAGKVRIDPGWPVSFTVFGGAPRYFEPTFTTNLLSQDETIWGGSMRTTRLGGTQLSLGYFGLERADRVLRQLVNVTASRTFATLLGVPSFYGSLSYDADHQNLDLGTAGVDLLWTNPRLNFNLEGTYYKPQDDARRPALADLNRREDPTFDLFAAGAMRQARAGVSHPFGPTLSGFVDYSFQHYDHIKDSQVENSHLASAGLMWLPGGDGLEVVRLQYYVIDSDAGRVDGGKALYENRVYERVIFRTQIEVTSYDKERNQSDTPISGLAGVGFVVLPGLTWEVNFEGNRNDRFDEDFRFGFLIEYNFRRRLARENEGKTL
ncbi:MAG: hypothetical protein HY699_20405 [Deltaproteobacteria bacterium]|nr:hypothetical protein [Deltaproteobacteria bacterium]